MGLFKLHRQHEKVGDTCEGPSRDGQVRGEQLRLPARASSLACPQNHLEAFTKHECLAQPSGGLSLSHGQAPGALRRGRLVTVGARPLEPQPQRFWGGARWLGGVLGVTGFHLSLGLGQEGRKKGFWVRRFEGTPRGREPMVASSQDPWVPTPCLSAAQGGFSLVTESPKATSWLLNV